MGHRDFKLRVHWGENLFFFFGFMLCSLRALSSLTRNWTQATAVKPRNPNHWATSCWGFFVPLYQPILKLSRRHDSPDSLWDVQDSIYSNPSSYLSSLGNTLWLHLQNNSTETGHLCDDFTGFKPSSEVFRSLPAVIEPLEWSLVKIISLLPENAPLSLS